MQNLSQHSPKQAHTSEREHQQTRQEASCLARGGNQKKVVCIIGGESEALGFHQETTEESGKQQDRFCIKLYIIFYEIGFVTSLCGFRTAIRTKTLFLTQVKYY